MKIRSILKLSSLLTLLLVFASLGAYAQFNFGKRGIKGNGVIQTEVRTVADFDAISVSNAISVFYTQGDQSIKVEADENLLELIETNVTNNKLVVKLKKNTNIKKFKKMNVYVSSRHLTAVSASGASDFVADGRVVSSKLSIDGSGAANIDLSVRSKQLKINGSGATDIKLTVDANDIIIDASGASDILLKGEADDLDAEVSGSTDLKAKELMVKVCNISVSGASDVEVTVGEYFSGNASGASDIIYYGNPETGRLSTSGTSKILKK